MAVFGPNVDSIIFTVLVLALPSIISQGRAFYNLITKSQPSEAPPNPTGLTKALSIIVLAHSAYVLYELFFTSPSNIFTALHLPITTPTSVIRLKLASYSPNGELPNPIEGLLTKLQNVDVRTYYVRFGHETVLRCDYCHSFGDFGLFAMPRIALEYVRTLVVLGLMTLPGSGKRSWRRWAIGGLAAGALLESWVLSSTVVTFSPEQPNVPMWHDRAWYARHGLFLILPILLHMLPYQQNPYSSLKAVPFAVQSVESTLSSLYVLEAVRRASLRDEDLRGRVGEFYAHDALTSRLAQRDEEIKEEAERAGFPFSRPNIGSRSSENGLGEDEVDGPLVASVKQLVNQWRGKMVALMRQVDVAPGPGVASSPATSL